MRENCTHGSEGGEASAFSTPIKESVHALRSGDVTPWQAYSMVRRLLLLWQTALHGWLGLGV